MPEVTLDKSELRKLLDYLWVECKVNETMDALHQLRAFDWNPFDGHTPDEKKASLWQQLCYDRDIVIDIAHHAVITVEKIVIGGNSLTSPQKHSVVVDFLDKVIRLPWYLEPFDRLALDLIVSAAVRFWKSIGWGQPAVDADSAQARAALPRIEWQEIGGVST